MAKKNVYFVQPNNIFDKAVFLPYAVGAIAAYSWQHEDIKEHYNLGPFIYKRESDEIAFEILKDPYLIGFSNYLWNFEYNLSLAKAIKRKYPKCVIVFGGHHVPPGTEFLEKHDFIDILVHGEGEGVFLDILRALRDKSDLETVCSISCRQADATVISTAEKKYTINNFPSPYLRGYFDEILKNDSKNYTFNAILETTRGCPNHCAYCDWSSLGEKMRRFPIKRVLSEIEWFSDNKIEYCYCADSNFGMFKRDLQIADKLIETKKATGYPKVWQVSYSKDSQDRVFELNTKLSAAGFAKGAALSLQTLNKTALKNIGRKNMTPKLFSMLMKMYQKEGLFTNTELILGLPGETLESFCSGLCRLIESGQHNSVSVYFCELLPNSLMSTPEYMEKYKIEAVTTILHKYHCNINEAEQDGHSNIIVSTYSMSREDWIQSSLFAYFVINFHHYGFLQCFALYLHNEKGVSYYTFYNSLMKWITENEGICNSIFTSKRKILNNYINAQGGLAYQNDIFGQIAWSAEESVFLQISLKLNEFYDEFSAFLKEFDIDKSIYLDIMKYQKNIIVQPGKNNFSFGLKYDLYNYYSNALANNPISLKEQKCKVIITNPAVPDNWKEFARVVMWHGRRNGKTMHTGYDKAVKIKCFD
ncbi:MAG TPA: radical SAM protein [Clostridia bacterium]|nr:radical SAM protein [Clostridia bacterium]